VKFISLIKTALATLALMFMSFILGAMLVEKSLTASHDAEIAEKLREQYQRIIADLVNYCETDGVFRVDEVYYACVNTQNLQPRKQKNEQIL
jgi:chaperone required for assembly of F1-ATPase